MFQPSQTPHHSLHYGGGKDVDESLSSSLKKVLTEVHHLRKDNDKIKISFEKLKE